MQQLLRPLRERVATAQPLAALPLTDAACPLRASGTRGRRNQWNTGDGNTGSAAVRDSKRETAQMRPCTPMTSAPSATGQQYRPGRRPKRARRQAQIGACTDTPTPVARRATAPERVQAAFSFGPCTARFSFGKAKEKWGGIPVGQAPWREPDPHGRHPVAQIISGRLITAPTSPRKLFRHRITPGGSRSHPAGRLTFSTPEIWFSLFMTDFS